MNAHQRIKTAQRANERFVLTAIRRAERAGFYYQTTPGLTTTRMYNALDRLEAAGRIRYVRARTWHGMSGWTVTK